MQELIHHTFQKIEGLLAQFNQVQELYLTRAYDFEKKLDEFLHAFLQHSRTKGDHAQESEILKVMNMISTVKRGFNPIKLEKIQTGKRDLFWGHAFNGLDTIHQLLQEIHQKERRKVDEGEEILSNLVISLCQNGIVSEEQLRSLDTIPKINGFWSQLLSQNASIMGINKKLRLQLSPEDIYLILERIILRINS